MVIAVPVGVACQATRSEPLNCLSENQIPAMPRRMMNSWCFFREKQQDNLKTDCPAVSVFLPTFSIKGVRGNCLFAWYFCGGYTTTRENRELRRALFPLLWAKRYPTTRENGELRQCLCPKYSVMISPHIISAFTVFVNPQVERNVFNKNSPWKWMLPSLEFPWQDFIRMTAEMQFAFWFTKRKQFSLDIGRLRRYNIPVSETGL